MKIILTAFHGLLKSKISDYEPREDKLLLPSPFETFDNRGILTSHDQRLPMPKGVFRRTGRIVDGADEWALVGIRNS